MLMRVFASTAAVAVLAIAAPAAAQSTFTHPNGWNATLPAGITAHPGGAIQGDRGVFLISRGGSQIGVCMINVALRETPVASNTWTLAVSGYNANPEAEAKGNSDRAGHAFGRLLGSRPYTSKAGWAGYFFWYERTNSTSNSTQISVNAATMLSATQRMVAVCNSNAGFLFDNADINAINSLVTSAKAN